MQKYVNHSPSKGFVLELQPAPAWSAMLGFALVSALCLLVHAGGVLRLGFPLGALMVGILLYWRYPILYLGFTWWIYFLTPWIRRLIDQQGGWVDPSTVMLTPYLVTGIAIATLIKYLPIAYRQGGLPFILGLVGVLHGVLIGLVLNPFTAVVPAALNWVSPLLFGFHLLMHWQDYPRYRRVLRRVFLWGVFVMGAYGVWQFMTAPPWDQYWMLNAPINSIGSPAPFEIRVFSTMNAPGPFATTMMAGLLLLFDSQGAVRLPAAGFGYLSFLLSLVRSAWLGWVVGLLAAITSLKAHLQMRLLITLLVMALGVLPLVTMPPFSETIQSRLQTFTNPQQDQSYSDRTAGYRESLNAAFSQFLGQGFGNTEIENNYSIGVRDSALLDMFFSLGWFGSIPYFGGLCLLSFALLQCVEAKVDGFINAARAIAFGVLAQFGFGSVMLGVTGMLLWGFAAMAMAGHRYYQQQQIGAQNLTPLVTRPIGQTS
ncbi:MAG: O-antigen ligase domain-containing protein [Leptolyngbyaceae bacterium]|nr:O-antigen ligase domain-containing protein [Leptolyngbyaceae bacterium]